MKSQLYTRTGDAGLTSLVGGKRVGKDDVRLEAYGTLDELNSHLGLLASAAGLDDADRATLQTLQCRLFDIGTLMATEPESRWQPQPPDPGCVAVLEAEIDRLDGALPRMHSFILPGGHADASRAHIARTVARRAERRMVALQNTGVEIDATAMRLVNRLSDYLFALARTINARAGVADTPWQPGS